VASDNHPGDRGNAVAVAGAATSNHVSGIVTSEALTTAAAADYVLTLSNNLITAQSIVLVEAGNGTNTTEGVSPFRVQPGAGSVVIHVRNGHATTALNGTILVSFIVF
jgi:hypothetical protein